MKVSLYDVLKEMSYYKYDLKKEYEEFFSEYYVEEGRKVYTQWNTLVDMQYKLYKKYVKD